MNWQRDHDWCAYAKKSEMTNRTIFRFICSLWFTVEVNSERENKHIQVPFMKRPACYMISKAFKIKYREECDIDGPSTKMLDLMRYQKIFVKVLDYD